MRRQRRFHLPLSGSARPGGSGVSFAHSAGGGDDGSACCWAESGALETWFEGLDEGLAEHYGWMDVAFSRNIYVVVMSPEQDLGQA